MTVSIFAILSALLTAVTIIAAGLYTSYAVIWMAAALFLGFFLALSVLVLLLMVLCALPVRLEREQTQYSAFYRRVLNLFLPLAMFYARVHVHLTGAEKLPRDTRYLLVCNHFYAMDPILLLRALSKEHLAFVAKQELYRIPVLAQFMHKLGCLPIDRDNDRAAVKSILKAAECLKRGQQNMGIFPEGYTNHENQLQPFRNGAFKIAQRAGTPIVIAVIYNSRTCQHRLFRRRSDIYIHIADVLPTDELSGLSTRDIGQIVHQKMEQALQNPPAALGKRS